MGDGDDLDFFWSDLAIDERVGETSNQDPASTVERAPALRVLQDVEDLVAHGCEEIQAQTVATLFVPVGRLFELDLSSRMKTVLASGHADAVRVGRRGSGRARFGDLSG